MSPRFSVSRSPAQVALANLARARFAPFIAAVVFAFVSSPVAMGQVGTCVASTGEAYLDVNNVRARIIDNGGLFYRGEPRVYEVPKGGDVNALFNASLGIGGLVDGELRVAATRYGPWEFWAGPIDDDGNAPADCSAYDRIWKVSQRDLDEYEADLTPATVDMREWPTGLGAPTLVPAANDGVDNNNDGEIDEVGEMRSVTSEVMRMPLAERIGRVIDLDAGERPDITGDQMLWWIMNDRGNAHNETGSVPLGVEVHARAFAIDTSGHVGNATFYKYSIYNKAGLSLDSAFVGLFVDPDLGYFPDDYVGSDTAHHMAYVYNADNDDEGARGYGIAPPSLGFTILEGPITPSVGDTAILAGVRVKDNRNLGMTSFMQVLKNESFEPDTTGEYYNQMKGRWNDGSPIRLGRAGYDADPGAPETRFMFPGDPVTGEFWSETNVDSIGGANTPSDRRMVAGVGPFMMNPGDQQDLTFAIVWARGVDNLDSVAELRLAAANVRTAYEEINVAVDDARFHQTLAVDQGTASVYDFVAGTDTVVTISFSDFGNVTHVGVLEHEAANPPGLTPALPRFFDVMASGDSFVVSLKVRYEEADLVSGGVTSPEADLRLIRWNGVRWLPVGGIVDTNRNTITVSGISAFGRLAIADPNVVFTGLDEPAAVADRQFELQAVYPNPTSGETHIRFENPEPARVRAELYDILGRRVKVLYDEDTAPGEHAIRSRLDDLSSGVYYVRLTSGSRAEVASIVVTR